MKKTLKLQLIFLSSLYSEKLWKMKKLNDDDYAPRLAGRLGQRPMTRKKLATRKKYAVVVAVILLLHHVALNVPVKLDVKILPKTLKWKTTMTTFTANKFPHQRPSVLLEIVRLNNRILNNPLLHLFLDFPLNRNQLNKINLLYQ